VTTTRYVAICHVLREDANLRAAIPTADRDKATHECIAAEARLHVGRWSRAEVDTMPGGIGLLVLHGLLIRHVQVGGRFSAELLGEGDVLRPWQLPEARPTLRYTSEWRVLEPTRLAVLDGRVARRFAHYPELTGRLAERALERSRRLAVNMAIVQQPRVRMRRPMGLRTSRGHAPALAHHPRRAGGPCRRATPNRFERTLPLGERSSGATG
jgi:hypothetical protein